MEEDVYATINYNDSEGGSGSGSEDGTEDDDSWSSLERSVEQLQHWLIWQLPDPANYSQHQQLANRNLSNETTMSTSAPNNQTEPSLDANNYWALLALVLVVGTAAGNILVCLAIAWERRLQNVTNYFLMSLAITDLMVAVLVMPLGILTLVKGELQHIFIKYIFII
ncbi:GH17576 [Drosophila grimshawi]|uniref:GH17576 n=1 Tax=Drosophila grimshawi TaxID=7222 RepID=B4JST0_DROGR|nr:GH17576 [Drosophila grimshawi]